MDILVILVTSVVAAISIISYHAFSFVFEARKRYNHKKCEDCGTPVTCKNSGCLQGNPAKSEGSSNGR